MARTCCRLRLCSVWQYDEIYVHEVLRGFAGEEQGVQRDDVILAIDGTVRSADPGG